MGKPLAVVSILLLVLTYLLRESRVSGQGPRARMQQSAQAMQLHDAELNRDVLMARAGLLSNYDSLARTGRNLVRDLDTLQLDSAALERRHAQAIRQDVVSLAATLKRKLMLIEYVKSDNALLRNSLAYFAQSLGKIRERGEMGKPAMEVAALSHAMLRFVEGPEPGTKKDAEAALGRIASVPARVSNAEPLTVHGQLIVQVLPRVDSLLDQIIASPIARQAEELQRAVLEYGTIAEARAQHFRFLLYAVALILLAYLVYQYTRLRARARELRQKEIQLIQANKMTALGTLVSGVAHEINNPNQVVLMNAEVMARAWDESLEILDAYQQDGEGICLAGLPYAEARTTLSPLIGEIAEGARRIQTILSDLKDFARPTAQASEAFQLNDVVHRALRLLGHVIHKRTDVFDVRLADELPCLQGNPQQVEQVVVNLVMNALEALPSRAKPVVVSTSFQRAERSVLFQVRDEGVGISRDCLSRLGEPFFTTKEASGGTGLGLAITLSLVRSHRGEIKFSSEPGRGTCATVAFPCVWQHEFAPALERRA
jgi:signal transduction histidine kinase